MKHKKLHEKQGHLGILGGFRKRPTLNVQGVRFNKVESQKVKGFWVQGSGVARQPFMAIMTSSCVSPVLKAPQ
jgi:hypothetical protein